MLFKLHGATMHSFTLAAISSEPCAKSTKKYELKTEFRHLILKRSTSLYVALKVTAVLQLILLTLA